MSKLFTLLLTVLAYSAVYAQCPGPSQRTNLINLQKSQTAEGTLAGQIPFSDDCGNLRYGQYVEIENTPVGFIPTATGNTSNYSEFVIASDSTRWYIDWQGRGYLFGSGGGGPDKNGYYGGNGGNGGNATIPSVTQSTLTNQLTFLRATDDAGGLVPIRIQVDAGNEPDFMSFKNLTDSLVIKRSDQDFEIKSTEGLSIYANTPSTPGNGGILLDANVATIELNADSIKIGTVPNNFTGERTFLTQSPNGFITKQEGISQEDLTFTPANIYNSNGTLPDGRTADVLGTFQLSAEDVGTVEIGDVNFDLNGDGIKVSGPLGQAMMGNVFGTVTHYIISGVGPDGNYIRTPASNLAQTGTNTIWDILSGNFKFTDSRATKKGLEYTGDYCTAIRANPLSIPSVNCVAGMISDSLGSIPAIPPGTINQTLRYSATDVLEANSQIFNNGSQVSIGTTVFPSAYEFYVLGDARINQKLFLGDAIGRQSTAATFGINDTTSGGSTVYWSQRRGAAGAPFDFYMRTNHSLSDPRQHFLSGAGEGQFNFGLDASANSFKFSTDAAGTLETQTVFTITNAVSASLPGNFGIQIDVPTARMHFAAQVDSEPSSAPIKLTMGNPLDDVEDGALEYVNTGVDDLNFTVGSDRFILGKCLTGTAALDFGNLNPTISEAQAITVTGAQSGDQCILGWDPAVFQNGISFQTFVQAANTVRVVATNMSGAAINLASGAYTARCFH